MQRLFLSLIIGIICTISAQSGEIQAQLITLPEMPPPILDGNISAAEWSRAAKLYGFYSVKNGTLITGEEGYTWLGTDGKSLFVAVKTSNRGQEAGTGTIANVKDHDGQVWSDDAVEIYITSNDGDNVYQFIINSGGTVFDAEYAHGVMNKSWNGKIFTANLDQSGWWTFEAAIPLDQFKKQGNKLLVNICRDWCKFGESTITGSKSYRALTNMLEVKQLAGAPVIYEERITGIRSNNINTSLQIHNPVRHDLNLDWSIYEENFSRPGKDVETYKIDSDRTVDFNHKLKNSANCAIEYQIKEKGIVLYQRQMTFATGLPKDSPNLRPCSFSAELEHSVLYGRLYPGFHRLSIEVDPGNWQKEKINKIGLTLFSPSKKEFYSVAVFNPQNRIWEAVIPILPGEFGTWHINLTYYGTPVDKIIYHKNNAASFETREYPWVGNQLGISDQIIPPFTPLKASENSVACILRDHTINNLGLWDQVKSLDSDILSGPITVEAVINGVTCSWQPKPLEFIKKLPNQIVTKSLAETSLLKWQSLCTWDYDGFMWVDVNLNSGSEIKIDRLTMTIPMKAQYCTLMHAVADTLRSNKAGIIPDGKGEVWNSSAVPKYRSNGKNIIEDSLIPYFWFGEERRGICWMVDSGKGFNLNPKIPQIRVFRTNKNEIVARIDIINQPTVIKQNRNFSFGLQATPVKPMPDKWRNWNLSCAQNEKKIQDMLNITFCMHGIGLGKTSNCASEPVNDDYSFMMALGRALKSNKPDYTTVKEFYNRIKSPYSEWMKKHESDHYAGYLKYKTGNESFMEQKIRFLDTYLNQNMAFTANTDILVPYTDPRLQIDDSEIAKYFMSEWWGPQAISYPGLYRTYPTPSNINYMLYVYKKHLDTGLGGIYIDDTYIMPGNDPLSDTAISEDGKQKPVMGLLAMRELIKRTAVLQHQMGINPRLLIVHCTNTFIIPCFVFADITYDWEMNYGAGDFQDRFSLDFVRTESTGLQAGCVGSVLGGIINSNNLSAKDWDVEKKRLTRTALAMTLLHEIQINATSHASDVQTVLKIRTLLKEFGIQRENCVFVPYWDKDSQIVVAGKDFRCSYYLLPGKVLAIVSNMGKEATAHLELHPETLGLTGKITLRDFENGKMLENQNISIPKHDFRMVIIE